MKNIPIILCICLVICGCGNSLSKGTLKSALNKYYNKEQPAIIKLDSFCCSSTYCTIAKSDDANIRKMDLLVKVGLMKAREYYEAANANFMAINDDKSPNTVEYAYTDMGLKYFKVVPTGPGMSDMGFAFGQNSVVEIKNYTQPSTNTDSQAGINVSFTTRTDTIADWANSNEMKNAFPEIEKAIDSQAKPVEDQASMIKTANGWQDMRQSL